MRTSILLLLGVLVSSFFAVMYYDVSILSGPSQVCTMEAKLCPDGTAVGRIGPHCEFAICPVADTQPVSSMGRLSGTVTLGPVCPVEHPDNSCLPTAEMYAARPVRIYTMGRAKLVKSIIPNENGTFTTTLAPGTYVVDMKRSSVGSIKGVPTAIHIETGKTWDVHIDVDTGIR